MAELNLETFETEDLHILKIHLEKFCDSHPELAEKINNGYAVKVKDEDGEHDLVCKKNLRGCYDYCSKKAIEVFEEWEKKNPNAYKNRRGGLIEGEKVVSWAITYFEEDDIKPDDKNVFKELFNPDGTEFVFKAPKPAAQKPKAIKTPLEEMAKPAATAASAKAKDKKSKGEQIGFDLASLFGSGTEGNE